MGTVLTRRDHDRFMARQTGLLGVVLVMSVGMVRAGASWGGSSWSGGSWLGASWG